jgi:hypothetical protein
MAAHRHSTRAGWWDTPIHPVLGICMFLAGFAAIWLLTLFATAAFLGR